MNDLILKMAAATALLVSGSQAAYASTQGTAGTTSTGTVSISASVPNRVQLTGLSDVAFTNQDPATAALSAQDVCVWSNTTTRGYRVTATGSGASSAFTLTNASDTVPYSVEWAPTSGQSAGTALATGTALTGLTSTATSPTCSSGAATTASLVVKIAAADLQAMQAASTYTGTLTLVVAPE